MFVFAPQMRGKMEATRSNLGQAKEKIEKMLEGKLCHGRFWGHVAWEGLGGGGGLVGEV